MRYTLAFSIVPGSADEDYGSHTLQDGSQASGGVGHNE